MFLRLVDAVFVESVNFCKSCCSSLFQDSVSSGSASVDTSTPFLQAFAPQENEFVEEKAREWRLSKAGRYEFRQPFIDTGEAVRMGEETVQGSKGMHKFVLMFRCSISV